MDLPECVCVILHFCIYPSILSPYHSFKISIGVVACYSSSFFDFITFHTSFDSDFPKALETFMFVFFTIFLRWDAKKQKGWQKEEGCKGKNRSLRKWELTPNMASLDNGENVHLPIIDGDTAQKCMWEWLLSVIVVTIFVTNIANGGTLSFLEGGSSKIRNEIVDVPKCCTQCSFFYRFSTMVHCFCYDLIVFLTPSFYCTVISLSQLHYTSIQRWM